MMQHKLLACVWFVVWGFPGNKKGSCSPPPTLSLPWPRCLAVGNNEPTSPAQVSYCTSTVQNLGWDGGMG